MVRTLVLAASVAALAVPAFAGDITISLAGKTKAQVIAEIHNAANSICAEEGHQPLSQHVACVAQVEQEALAELAAREKTKS